jgi:PEP-CTERM motif
MQRRWSSPHWRVTLGNGLKARGLASVSAVVSELTVDTMAGDVLAASSIGGAIESAKPIEDTLNGGEVHFKNLQFDLPGRMVYADIGYRVMQEDGTLAPLINREHVAMWTVSSIQGPTSLPFNAIAAAQGGDFSQLQGMGIEVQVPDPNAPDQFVVKSTTSFQGLRVTSEGLGYVALGLGLVEGSLGYDALDKVNAHPEGWGRISANLYFAAASVPEPSQALLMGLGLLGVAWKAGKRRQAA